MQNLLSNNTFISSPISKFSNQTIFTHLSRRDGSPEAGKGKFRQTFLLDISRRQGGNDFIAVRQTLAGNQSPNESRTRVNPHHATTQKSMTVGLTGEDIPLSVSGHEQQIGENGESGMKG
ncbi:hypothetical protein V6N12_049690 [Hibiscus sabdariffa]|uniref:Uncharacterized protein n=1 Tax=Hibiscus sabdariffa TaxID=183260 RepID=A0ABR2GA98_9ROSI